MAILKLLALVVPASFLPVLAYWAVGGRMGEGAWNPVALFVLVATGKRQWPIAASIILIVLVVLTAALATVRTRFRIYFGGSMDFTTLQHRASCV